MNFAEINLLRWLASDLDPIFWICRCLVDYDGMLLVKVKL